MNMDRIGLIFDLDNTLVQSRIDFRGMAAALVRRLVDAFGSEALPPGLGDRRVAEIIDWAEHHVKDSQFIQGLWEIVTNYETRGMENLVPEPGAVETVRRLADTGCPLAICTNNAREATLKALEFFGQPPPFDPVVSRTEVRRIKPASEGIHLIKDVWRRHSLEALVMIGDSWLDGKAAEGAGIHFVAYVPGGEGRLSGQVVPVWRHITHLREILEPEAFAELVGRSPS